MIFDCFLYTDAVGAWTCQYIYVVERDVLTAAVSSPLNRDVREIQRAQCERWVRIGDEV